MKAAVILWDDFQAEDHARKGAAALKSFSGQGWETELWLVEEIQERENPETCNNGIREADWIRQLPYDTVVMISGMGDPSFYPKQYKLEIQQMMQERGVSVLLLTGTEKGREIGASLAVLMDKEFASSVTGIWLQKDKILYDRNVYNCNLAGTFQQEGFPFVATLDHNAYEAEKENGCPQYIRTCATAEKIPSFDSCRMKLLPQSDQFAQSKRILVSGRGASSAPVMADIQKLAVQMQAQTGATRPVVLEGRAPYSNMVGMTGSLVNPELCMAFGVSGAAPFLVGIQGSRVIVAVNQDEDAAIFRNCDFGVVDDAEAFLKSFLQIVSEKEHMHG